MTVSKELLDTRITQFLAEVHSFLPQASKHGIAIPQSLKDAADALDECLADSEGEE